MTTTPAYRSRRPYSVLVGSVTYTISWVHSSEMDKPRDLKVTPQRYGDCEAVQAKIRIATDVPLTMQKATLYHEITHAVTNVFGAHRHQSLRDYIALKRKSPWRIEELYIQIFEHMMEVQRDNPRAFEWIFSE